MSQDFSSASFPRLETKRLLLRQTTLEDVEAVFAVFSDPKVTQFHNRDRLIYLHEASQIIERRAKGFKSGRGIRWAIAVRQNNYLIGSCGFTWHRQANAAEVGYELSSQYWRQGIMSEALRAILQYGFIDREIQFVIADIMIKNIASKKLLEKLGFQSQGILEKHGFWKAQHHDLERFKMTKTELTTSS